MDEWLSLRTLNAALGAIALVLLLVRTVQSWRKFGPRARLLSQALLALLLTGIFGSIEAQAQDAPIGTRTYMVAVAYLWIIVAFTITARGPFYRK